MRARAFGEYRAIGANDSGARAEEPGERGREGSSASVRAGQREPFPGRNSRSSLNTTGPPGGATAARGLRAWQSRLAAAVPGGVDRAESSRRGTPVFSRASEALELRHGRRVPSAERLPWPNAPVRRLASTARRASSRRSSRRMRTPSVGDSRRECRRAFLRPGSHRQVTRIPGGPSSSGWE